MNRHLLCGARFFVWAALACVPLAGYVSEGREPSQTGRALSPTGEPMQNPMPLGVLSIALTADDGIPPLQGPELDLNPAPGSAGANPHSPMSPQKESAQTPQEGAPAAEAEGKMSPEQSVQEGRSGGQAKNAEGASRDDVSPQKSLPSTHPDSHEGESKTPAVNPRKVGHPLASGIVQLLPKEIATQLQSSGVDSRFQQFRAYAASRLAATRGDYTGSEINGLARLGWFDRLLRDPLTMPQEAEEFTRYLHAGALSDRTEGLRFLLRTARPKLDVPPSGNTSSADGLRDEGGDPLKVIEKVLLEVRNLYAQSVKPLSQAEYQELARRLNYVMTTNVSVGHTVNDRGGALRLVRILQKMDRAAQWDMAETLAELADRVFLEQLRDSLVSAKAESSSGVEITGVSGKLLRVVNTAAGTILVGGPGSNEYRLEEVKDVVAVIDTGGDDVYVEGTVSAERPVLVIIDFAGNDRYQGTLPGIQGGSILGASLLVDWQGNDVYWARDMAQGSTLGGVGILVDRDGDDQYLGVRRVQGQALGGIGLLIDRGGKDDYHAAMWAQGFAGPLGFGLIDDLAGDDHYYVGGQWYDSYPETPGYEGWGQGVGSGIRGAANGGIGVLLEGAGDDVYEFDYFGQGGGYWLGIGLARDFAGNDRRLGATSKAFNGSARTQQRFQRFGNGWGCHMAVGALIDDAGDDEYHGSIMGTGFAWDLSVGYLLELGGNDRYLARVGGVQGQGAQAGLGVLYDFEGTDEYAGTSQGYSSSSITYHPYPTCGGNFSFVVDYGGLDKYGSGVKNNAISRRGFGGFVVDRPKLEELEAAEATPVTRAALGD